MAACRFSFADQNHGMQLSRVYLHAGLVCESLTRPPQISVSPAVWSDGTFAASPAATTTTRRKRPGETVQKSTRVQRGIKPIDEGLSQRKKAISMPPPSARCSSPAAGLVSRYAARITKSQFRAAWTGCEGEGLTNHLATAQPGRTRLTIQSKLQNSREVFPSNKRISTSPIP